MTAKIKLNRCMHQSLEASCPCCGRNATFRYGGEQKWPKKVTEKLGLPESVALYHCDACNSTISAHELR